ncbi:MAG: TolC family protein [Desulfobacteraceae bacterium]|nr:MAG: TolC family protein [Desulfobacteraceae bacterium]
MTLARAKKIALENHPSMDSAMERVRQAQEVVTQARAAYLPTLSASAGWDYMEDTQGGSQAVDEIQYTQRLSVTQVLFNGFYRKYSLESAKNRESMSRDDLSESRRLLSWAVAQAFLNLQLALENVKTAASDMTFNQRLESEAIAKQAAGAGSLSDVLNFRTKVNAAKASVLSAQQDRLEASYALAALMGYKDACLPEEMAIASLSNRVGLPDQIQTDGFGPDVDQIEQIQVEQILADRPDLNKAALSVKNVENDIQMVKAAYFPTISLTGSYGTSSGNQWFDTDNMGASVGVSVTFEIFSGGTRQSRLRQSMAEKRELEKDLEEARMTARSNIRTAAGNIEMTSRQLALQTENTELVRTTRDLVEKEYRAGQESLVRLNEAQNELISSLGELSRAKVSLVLALEEFDYYIGENFE